MTTSEIAVVTGASSGIGRAIALRLARDGFHVAVHYNKNEKGARETQEFIRSAGGSADVLRFEIRNSADVEKAMDEYAKLHGEKNVAVLVNNAGIHIDGLAGLMTDQDFTNVMETNVNGPFYLMRWCVRRMLKRRTGAIVNVASLAGQTGNAGQINYSASKAALIAMTKSLSFEVGARGIRVNAVAPGLIETEMLQGVPGLEELKTRIPLKRLGLPDEVAGCVSFLCSKDASYVTGHTLSVNGGLYPA